MLWFPRSLLCFTKPSSPTFPHTQILSAAFVTALPPPFPDTFVFISIHFSFISLHFVFPKSCLPPTPCLSVQSIKAALRKLAEQHGLKCNVMVILLLDIDGAVIMAGTANICKPGGDPDGDLERTLDTTAACKAGCD